MAQTAPKLVQPDPADLAVLEPPRTRRWLWLGGGALALAAILGWALSRGGGGGPQLETVTLASGPLVQRVTAVGQLEPLEQVEIGSDLNGEIVQLEVDVNDRVSAGDVLARLDPEPFETTVTQSRASVATHRANLQKARVELERATAELARTERLFERGAATAVELQEAKLSVAAAGASVDSARASRDQAQATLERADQDLQDTVITSPIDGVVVRRLVDEGQTVVSSMSATPLFEVAADLAALKVDVDVDEADVGLVAAGQPATFTVAAWPDRTFEATVRSVDLAADTTQSVVVYGTELWVDNDEGVLRPGMTATAEIQVGKIEDALLVPTYALRYRPERAQIPDGDHLWTLEADELVAVPVRVGGSDGSTTAVYGDQLSEGMVVVVGGGR